MSRSILSLLCFILVPGFCFLGLYNIHLATFGRYTNVIPSTQESERMQTSINLGSMVTLRALSPNVAGYLYSHALNYPSGSLQQQVALVPQRSENTTWRVYNASANYQTREQDALSLPRQQVIADMAVRLEHVPTRKHLHSHDIAPPVSSSEGLSEVTGYGLIGFPGDANDNWVVELTEGSVLTVMAPFKLRHQLTGGFLSSRGEILPAWGLGLQEVVCDHRHPQDTLWVIEESH
ncbi:MIR motif-containing protein, partial [Mycena rebaudengoi]